MFSLNKIKKQSQNEIDKLKIFLYYKLSKPYQLKMSYDSIIPLHLYTCWHTKDLPPLMKNNFEFLKESNPKITFHLFDEEDCINFIKNNFDLSVLNAYNSLIPCSYKSDLWRFCVLYINGGIYMDIKYRCVNGFKFISLTEKEYFVRDSNVNDVYTALIVSLPKNNIILNCINKILENVKNKYYGNNCLDPTGPGLLGKFFTKDQKNGMELYHSFINVENKLNKYFIVKNDRIILNFYDDYREEQNKYQKKKHYCELWNERQIYLN
jgi:hypothetical protein